MIPFHTQHFLYQSVPVILYLLSLERDRVFLLEDGDAGDLCRLGDLDLERDLLEDL